MIYIMNAQPTSSIMKSKNLDENGFIFLKFFPFPINLLPQLPESRHRNPPMYFQTGRHQQNMLEKASKIAAQKRNLVCPLHLTVSLPTVSSSLGSKAKRMQGPVAFWIRFYKLLSKHLFLFSLPCFPLFLRALRRLQHLNLSLLYGRMLLVCNTFPLPLPEW